MQDKEESVPLFIMLVVILSSPFWVLETIYPFELLPGLPISALGAFTPTLAALILTFKNDGFAGALQLLQRSVDFRRIKNAGWYLVIILINPAIAVMAYAIMCGSGVVLPAPTPVTIAVLPMFVLFFIGALGEEIGWSGYATEPLEHRWGTLGAGLLLGSIWAVWHFIPLTQAHRSFEWMAWWSLGTLSLRTIMVWLYTHAGKSVFGAAVFHAMINLCWQLFPSSGSHYDPRVFGLITFGLTTGILAVQFLLSRRKMPSGSTST